MKKIALILIVFIIAFVSLIGVGAIYILSNVNINSNMSNISSNMNVVVSESMAPALHRGDIIIVDKNPNNIQVGDIVVYKPIWFSQPVVHRVIAIKNDSNGNTVYQMKGDNNPLPDPEASKSQIMSKVVNTIPKIGYITLWIRRL